jgi:hypothetical protein
MRSFAATALLLAAGACAPLPPPYAGPPPGAPPPPPMNTQCGAGTLQWLVGRDRSEVPPAPPSRDRRVYARGDALTMDYSPMRLNIEYDRASGRVLRVYCG